MARTIFVSGGAAPRVSLRKSSQDRTKVFIPKKELNKFKWYSKARKEQRRGPVMKLGKSHKFGPWADLSGDLLRTIVDKLSPEDQASASVVCKDWRSAITRMPTVSSGSYGPWRFCYTWEKSDGNPKLNISTELHNPYSIKSYFVDCSHWNSRTKFAFGAAPCALRHGWFLFAKKFRCKTYFFLYQAYSKRRIWLPYLRSYYNVATFSKTPLSPDCVVFASYRSGSRIHIATCGIGDKKWKKMLVDAEDPVSSVVYGEEKNEFYCVFPGGILGSFTVSDQTWNLLSQHGHGKEERTHHHLLQYEGQLLLMVKKFNYRFHIFRFDWSAMKWVVPSNIDSSRGAGIEDFNNLFSKNLGDGSFLFLNQNYLTHRKDIWIDPPTVGN